MASDYTIFVDESFDGFMNLSKMDGYFCYAALMVPTDKLPDLERFWSRRKEVLVCEYAKTTGYKIVDEFKSGYLNKLNFNSRKTLGEKLDYFLKNNKCFVAGYYTSVKNYLAYNLRTNIASDDEAKELPNEWELRLPEIRNKLLKEKPENPGDSYLLVHLFHALLSIAFNWMVRNKSTFTVIYDPRQRKEDKFVIEQVGDWIERAAKLFEHKGFFHGASSAISSNQSAGLMLTDLILRDVRFLFTDFPELLAEGTGRNLVLPVPQEYETIVTTIKGQRMKWGHRIPMSSALRAKLESPSQNSMLPIYSSNLADMKLSFHAAFGESRTASFRLWCFDDMVD